MSESTLEKLEKLIYEGFKETDRKWQETDRKWQETDRKWQETDRKWQETDRRIAESDKKMKEIQQQMANDWKKFKLEMKAENKHLSKIVGAIGNKFGSFTEGLFLPSLDEIFLKKFGLEYTNGNSKAQNNGNMIELDAYAYSKRNPQSPVFIAEIKSHLKPRHIEQLKHYMQQFTDFYPDFKGRKIYGLLAGVKLSKETKSEIYKNGIYLAIASKDQFKLIEYPESFQPFYVQ